MNRREVEIRIEGGFIEPTAGISSLFEEVTRAQFLPTEILVIVTREYLDELKDAAEIGGGL